MRIIEGETAMKNGIIRKYDRDRGFGFIREDDSRGNRGGGEYFFHISELRAGDPAELAPGAAVRFRTEFDKAREKLRAADVELLPAGATELHEVIS